MSYRDQLHAIRAPWNRYGRSVRGYFQLPDDVAVAVTPATIEPAKAIKAAKCKKEKPAQAVAQVVAQAEKEEKKVLAAALKEEQDDRDEVIKEMEKISLRFRQKKK